MIIAADASVLVGELLRNGRRDLILHPRVQLVVAEHQWSEVEHDRERRLSIMESRGRITAERRNLLEGAAQHLVDVQGIEVVPRSAYEQFEEAARRRVSYETPTTGRRSPSPWPSTQASSPETMTSSAAAVPPGRSRRFRWSWGSQERGTDNPGDLRYRCPLRPSQEIFSCWAPGVVRQLSPSSTTRRAAAGARRDGVGRTPCSLGR